MLSEREKVLKPFIDQADYMNERISTGIELYRKGRFQLKVVDAEGAVIPNAKISVKQKSHEFRIGANLFALNEMENEDKTNEYKRLFADCFNLATLPFYWGSLEPEKGKTRYAKDSEYIYRRPPIETCLEFCEQYGVEPKAHCLDYDGYTPQWYKELNNLDDLRSALYDRFAELSNLFAHRIPTWEVTNELLFRPNEKSSAHLLQNDTLEWDFRTADRLFPKNKLILNEAADNIWLVYNGNRSTYYMLIERALRNGCRIDSIGMQFHVTMPVEKELTTGASMYSPERIYKVLDKYAEFSLPIQITESSIPSFDCSEANEDIQAEILKNLYSIWFSHSNMEAIIYWDFVDGYEWSPHKCGFVKKDLTPKKAYYTIRDLFNKTWNTSLDIETNADGRASFKGFYGEYEITVGANEKEITIPMKLFKNGKRDFKITL